MIHTLALRFLRDQIREVDFARSHVLFLSLICAVIG